MSEPTKEYGDPVPSESHDLRPQAKFREFDVPEGTRVLHIELPNVVSDEEVVEIAQRVTKAFQNRHKDQSVETLVEQATGRKETPAKVFARNGDVVSKSEVIYVGHNGLIVATADVKNPRGEAVAGHYYEIGTKEESLHAVAFQNGPVPEVGINGVTSEALLAVLIHRTEELNKNFPCEENERAIEHMKDALAAFEERTAKRIARGVEGTYKV